MPLECKTNPLDVEGKDTKTICGTAEPVIVTGTFTGSEPLPPYSIGARVPGPDDCTITSILRPAWTFSDAWVTTTKDNVTTIQFFIIMRASTPGFQGPISVTQGKPVKGNETWFECELGDGGNTGSELWPTKCTMKFDPATKTLSLDAEWACNDLDPDHP